MSEQIEALARARHASVTMLIEHDGHDGFADAARAVAGVRSTERSLAFTEIPDAIALFAWLHQVSADRRARREIASEADDDAALTHEARQLREAEAMGDLLTIERRKLR